jgi:hypothetical protein
VRRDHDSDGRSGRSARVGTDGHRPRDLASKRVTEPDRRDSVEGRTELICHQNCPGRAGRGVVQRQTQAQSGPLSLRKPGGGDEQQSGLGEPESCQPPQDLDGGQLRKQAE